MAPILYDNNTDATKRDKWRPEVCEVRFVAFSGIPMTTIGSTFNSKMLTPSITTSAYSLYKVGSKLNVHSDVNKLLFEAINEGFPEPDELSIKNFLSLSEFLSIEGVKIKSIAALEEGGTSLDLSYKGIYIHASFFNDESTVALYIEEPNKRPATWDLDFDQAMKKISTIIA